MFNDSMLPSIPDELMFQPNPSEKHTQPILQDNVDVLQEARDGLDDIVKDNLQSIVSKSPTDTGRTKLLGNGYPQKRTIYCM